MARQIGTLGEKSLHAALKAHYAQPGDRLECDLGGYVIDIVRADEARGCVEIQTRNLAKMKPKLSALLDQYPVRVVYPVALERQVVRIDADGAIRRRRSPKRGTVYHVFPELVSLPALLDHPNLTIEVLLVRDEQILIDDGRGSWRRKHWSLYDRKLIEVVTAVTLTTKTDYAALVPADLPAAFDTAELAAAIRQPRALAQKMAYCLRELGVFQLAGKRRQALLYTLAHERI